MKNYKYNHMIDDTNPHGPLNYIVTNKYFIIFERLKIEFKPNIYMQLRFTHMMSDI